MTIRALDFEMNAIERNKFCLMLGFGLNAPLPLKGVIIAQSHPLPKKWAAQMAEAFKPGVVVNPVAHQDTTLEQIVASIKYAITESNGGLLILAVGHGITSSDMPNQGGLDMAERAKMRIGGKDSFRNPKTFVDVFYEDKPPSGSTIPFSEKELDERTHPAGWERRLKNNATYKDLCKAFVDGKLAGVVLLTCRVGNSAVFLQKVATQWDTPIIAYRDWMIYQGGFPRKRVRAILQKDVGRDKTPNPGTNTPFAEVMFPLSRTEMIVVRPNAGP